MKKTKGFTLIELLVVIAIIGILATVVLVSLNSARSKSRDARRVSDLRQIALALEMYSSENGGYPAVSAITTCTGSGTTTTYGVMTAALVTAGYLPSVPKDPSDGTTYFYAYGANSTTANGATDYALKALLENTTSDLLDNSIKTVTFGCPCATAGVYCVGP
jgi:type II secretion system protein G